MGLLLLVMSSFLYFVFLMVFVTNTSDRTDRDSIEVNSTPIGHFVNLKGSSGADDDEERWHCDDSFSDDDEDAKDK